MCSSSDKKRFVNDVSDVSNKKEFDALEWTNEYEELYSDFVGLYFSPRGENETDDLLMALFDFDENYKGCTTFKFIGLINGDGDKLGLENYKNVMGDHLDFCAQKFDPLKDCNCGFKK
jgi:hypothetical protein